MNRTFLKESRYFHKESGLDLLRSSGSIGMSWGIELITMIEEDNEPRAMTFNVNGLKWQGTVVLSINFMDYYEVRFMQGGEIIEDMTVEVQDITKVIDTIDEVVEKQEFYTR